MTKKVTDRYIAKLVNGELLLEYHSDLAPF
jgi:hypothetical protein